jgi:hypothetical protein
VSVCRNAYNNNNNNNNNNNLLPCRLNAPKANYKVITGKWKQKKHTEQIQKGNLYNLNNNNNTNNPRPQKNYH